MTGTFVALIFGFCARVADNGNIINFGYQSSEKCVEVLDLTDSNPKSDQLVINQHQINWEWLEGGAEIGIDEQRFVLMKFGVA